MVARSDGYEGMALCGHSNEPDCILIQGYLNNPTATKESITTDGWYKTGDVCTRDAEGCYTIVDRIKELIKYKVCLPTFPNNLGFRALTCSA